MIKNFMLFIIILVTNDGVPILGIFISVQQQATDCHQLQLTTMNALTRLSTTIAKR